MTTFTAPNVRADNVQPRFRLQVRVVGLGLAVVTFALHLWFAKTLESLGAFDARDVLFDADISTRLRALSDWMPLGIKHPNLMFFFSPLVASVAKALELSGFVDMPEPEVRRAIGILVVPLASALQSVIVLHIFLRLELGLWRALLLSTLMLASFSSLIFGSIPESYGLTALCMALAFWFATVKEEEAHRTRRYCGWILLCTFATGITISNIAFVGVVLWAQEIQRSSNWRRATANAIGLTVIAFMLTGIGAYLVDRLIMDPHDEAARGPIEITQVVEAEASSTGGIYQRVAGEISREFSLYLHEKPTSRLVSFPTSLAQTFAPKETYIVENVTGEFRLAFTLEDTPRLPRLSDPLGVLLLVLIIWGALLALHSEPSWRVMTLGAAGVIAGSWLMSVWGREVFLYSQTWHLAAMMFVAMTIRGEQHKRGKTVALVLLNLGIAGANAVTIANILEVLRALG